ncbi:hypothetical protein WM09_19845 [Burkholderia ubonensis]|nr:hypothetical protein WI83_22395 [Burkholderia ubonensis]KVP35055.1 hypothetical protein WJ87_14745 [Burkholderia ubonensis]KVQ08622.1 hypothetical protein WK00_07730 [Burkholderia ubonensis]KWE72342.1 hypothetical protein WL78_10415 [Burkholderia ubonensis]KWI84481.1 hypothetical protein WM09_19845 [Burkholderia ubonensis]
MSVQDIVRAMQGALLQQDRLLKLDTPLGDNVLLPQRSLGWSRIGRHFDFTLDVLSTRNDLKLKSLIGQPVTLWNGLYTVTVLNAGSRSSVDLGAPVALEGHKTSCGAVLLAQRGEGE